VIMPRRSGPELAVALSARDPGLKVLFQSGYTGEAVLRRANIKPDMALLKKPFTMGALAKKIRQVLDL
jgi:FixJ family two-component response regulator